MDCEILTIGTELVLGFTINTNAADMGRALAAAGLRVRHSASVIDEPALVKDAVRAALDRTGTVIISGGLGPTKDDLTKAAVAELFGKPLRRDDTIVTRLRELFTSRGVATMPESNLVQADVPEGATVLENPIGTAPGLWIEADGRLAVLLPGVPKEMRALLEREVIPRLVARAETGAPGHRGTVTRSLALRTTGIGESALADKLGDYSKLLGPQVTLAFLPSVAGTDLRLTAWNVPKAEADAVLARAADALRPKLGDRVYGRDSDDLAAIVLRQLESAGLRLAVAESCTGGLLGARLTAIPGSSRVFAGGVIAYANDAKLQLLGVSADDLAGQGAVSETVARQMAAGVARALDTEAAIAITGVAGPDGGTPDKPVGTVWIAVKFRATERAFTHIFVGDREDVRARAVQWALDDLRRIMATAS
jgi:nicotinamide-nucleotide amidase